ncbi:Aste57867_23903 [Aphanomyces stellatus]|uniref:Aste57867_23903 protein n=1 Tax=Aphanomyces stellatus TaxID=120398 RepID=A0A485LNZ4_9STRA|nr:hypothetical protein As57867_023830 [Aphanomyces stellatus]VFU00546.1 Aste57867_23903 [Aphanomyces stellatus]
MVAESAYEAERAAKIARNKAMLASLGIEKPAEKPARGRPLESRKRPVEEPMQRRSSRLQEQPRPTSVDSPMRLRRKVSLQRNVSYSEVEAVVLSKIAETKIILDRHQRQRRGIYLERAKNIKPNNARTDTTYSTNEKNRRLMNDTGVDAPRRIVHEYQVSLDRGSHGLCINLGILKQCVCVVNFRRPAPNVLGPAELCGQIKPGDKLVSIDGHILYGGDDFKRRWESYRTAAKITLGFRRFLGEA